MRQWFVYILASKQNGTLYIGVTNDLARRGDEHKAKEGRSFTQKYRVTKLVYYESFDSPDEAIRREKNMKAWKRYWKLKRINHINPDWRDLSKKLLD
ncbi:MAG TPA: GIY-YIG nuclease family protein [Candidatus Saccharimonadales bacterium]|nr:GIY-YIG nuclease family protein [Candidatus Saccharimonadales bacterium]